MPLSEEELRLLEQMERALVEEDPKFASTLRGTSLRRSARRRAIVAGVVFVLGIAMLMGGVMSGTGALGFAIGIAGFVVMLGSATVALTAIRGQQHASAPADPRRAMHPSRGFTVIDGGRTGRLRRQRRSARRPPAPSWSGWKSAGVAAASRVGSEPHTVVCGWVRLGLRSWHRVGSGPGLSPRGCGGALRGSQARTSGQASRAAPSAPIALRYPRRGQAA